MVEKATLEKVKECLSKGQRFVLTTHINPDGDGLGSEAALAAYLDDQGKEVFIFNTSPVPHNYKFLDPENKMIVYEPEAHKELLVTADYIIILDISDWERLREVGLAIRDLKIPKICIDHHPPHDKFGDLNLVDIEASSTGEIVYDLLQFCQAKITRRIAEALYTSILTDTGSFRFSNTTSRAFRIAGELVEAGANPQKIYHEVYEHQPPSKIRLLGYVLYNLRLEDNGRIAWITVPKHILEELKANNSDTEGFADYLRIINGVEITVMFIELSKNRLKVSLRSKGKYVVNTVAQKFGGGGHAYAAGVLIEGSLEEYIPKVLHEVKKLLKQSI
ncbi:MAG: bifunctional oligoribonuclease/PAP phosphatase NrnA [Calditrichaeota bacterium]|nr:MAG: bifunctional oligoribonuclease/PAP phosphatase NrnA [Calditrichota bacterium]